MKHFGIYTTIKLYKDSFLHYIRSILFGETIEDPKKTPIIINNYNRLDTLKQLVSSLESRGYTNIYILDNNSTYPPLLEYYSHCFYPVFLLHKNYGHMAIWESGIYNQFKQSCYVYSDSDIVLSEECPDDFMFRFYSVLKRHPFIMKVGFGLRIDDLPDCYHNKNKVIEWESQFWEKTIEKDVYEAPIDTTFALYRPYFGEARSTHRNARTASPYLARHLPWYVDDNNLPEEEVYYLNHCNQTTHWSGH